jgi:hypothetical protein
MLLLVVHSLLKKLLKFNLICKTHQPVEKVFIMQQSRGLMELFIEANSIIRKPQSLLKSIIDTIEQRDVIENRGKPS